MTKVHGAPFHHVDYNAMVEGINQNGVLSGLAVSQHASGANMSVDVAAGSALIDEAKYIETSVTNVTIDASEAGKHRKDTIIYDTATSAPIAIKGTSVVVSDVAVPPSVTDGDILLAVVYVGDAVTTIIDANIYDGRIIVSAIKDNWTAVTDPDNNDDTGDGYEIGSRWINTSKKSYFVCTDATAASAVWRGTYSAATAPTVTDDDAHGFTIGSQWVDTANDLVYVCTDATTGAAAWLATTPPVPLIAQSIATIASSINGFLLAAVPAGMMNAWASSLNALIFNESAFTSANTALIFNEDGFTVANKALVCNESAFTPANNALVFRETGLSIANINAIIIHDNITDDNAQQILSEITKADRDLTSLDCVYEMLDDWNDNKITGRDGAGTASTGFTNLFAHKDLFRLVWTQVSGTTTAAGGKMVFNESLERVKTPSTFAVGTWEIVTAITAIANNKGFEYYFMYVDNTHKNLIQVERNASGNPIFNLTVNSTNVISGTWSNDAAEHTYKVTRDGSGNFEIFEDTVSKGTGTNTDQTTSIEIHIADLGNGSPEFNATMVH